MQLLTQSLCLHMQQDHSWQRSLTSSVVGKCDFQTGLQAPVQCETVTNPQLCCNLCPNIKWKKKKKSQNVYPESMPGSIPASGWYKSMKRFSQTSCNTQIHNERFESPILTHRKGLNHQQVLQKIWNGKHTLRHLFTMVLTNVSVLCWICDAYICS